MKYKILCLSDNPLLVTGYATQSREIWKRLCRNSDYDVKFIGAQYVGRPMYVDYDNHTLYGKKKDGTFLLLPHMNDRYGVKCLPYYTNMFKPDLVWILLDTFMVHWLTNREFPVKTMMYYPSDGEPLPINSVKLLNKLTYKVAMSKFCKKQSLREGVEAPVHYIPHGVNTDLYYPQNRNRIERTLKYWSNFLKIDLMNKWIAGAVFRNQGRKAPGELIKVWAEFSKNKEDVILFLHTDEKDPASPNSLRHLIKRYKVEGKVIFSGMFYGMGLTEEELADVYNMFKVHILTTTGEGFGIPTLEAASCGVPSVITDFTTTPELVYGRGEAVPLATTIVGTFNVERGIVSKTAFIEKLNKLYHNEKLRKKYSIDCRNFAKQFDWRIIVPQWDEYIRRCIENG